MITRWFSQQCHDYPCFVMLFIMYVLAEVGAYLWAR